MTNFVISTIFNKGKCHNNKTVFLIEKLIMLTLTYINIIKNLFEPCTLFTKTNRESIKELNDDKHS